jgi:hypothetical protein
MPRPQVAVSKVACVQLGGESIVKLPKTFSDLKRYRELQAKIDAHS